MKGKHYTIQWRFEREPLTDPYETMCCCFCASPTTGTVRIGDEDWAVCSKLECSEAVANLIQRIKEIRS